MATGGGEVEKESGRIVYVFSWAIGHNVHLVLHGRNPDLNCLWEVGGNSEG